MATSSRQSKYVTQRGKQDKFEKLIQSGTHWDPCATNEHHVTSIDKSLKQQTAFHPQLQHKTKASKKVAPVVACFNFIDPPAQVSLFLAHPLLTSPDLFDIRRVRQLLRQSPSGGTPADSIKMGKSTAPCHALEADRWPQTRFHESFIAFHSTDTVYANQRNRINPEPMTRNGKVISRNMAARHLQFKSAANVSSRGANTSILFLHFFFTMITSAVWHRVPPVGPEGPECVTCSVGVTRINRGKPVTMVTSVPNPAESSRL